MDAAGDKLMEELRAAVAAAEALLSDAGEQSAERLRELRDRTEDALKNARGKVQGAGKELDEQVREHPWAAVAIAAGIGLVVGVLLSRK